jgi:rubrerythrin|uniref:Rubrerythrin n=1 Tax=candidate division WOR-3 bacterium TaxID=2052148 RepID=A0A7V3PS42_UNCW3
MSEFHDETQVLNTALTAEIESLKRYLEYAWETADLAGKNMFIRLAMDEFMHQELIKKMLKDFQSIGKCLPAEVPPTLIEQLIPKIGDKNLQIRGKKGQTDLEALLTALELEKKTKTFYTTSAEKTQLASLRSLLIRLAQMEQAHQDLIQAEIDSIQQTGFWLGFKEFTLEANP